MKHTDPWVIAAIVFGIPAVMVLGAMVMWWARKAALAVIAELEKD